VKFLPDRWIKMLGVHDEVVHRDDPHPVSNREPGGANVVLVNAHPYLHQVPHFLEEAGTFQKYFHWLRGLFPSEYWRRFKGSHG
jgi:hypothetical protein